MYMCMYSLFATGDLHVLFEELIQVAPLFKQIGIMLCRLEKSCINTITYDHGRSATECLMEVLHQGLISGHVITWNRVIEVMIKLNHISVARTLQVKYKCGSELLIQVGSSL